MCTKSSPSFATYSAFQHYLDTLGLFHIHPSLDAITSVLKSLSLLRPPFTVVQVVGTNGKGSTATMLSSIASAHEVKTGLFTSPHFLSPRERIRINGTMQEEEAWLCSANAVMNAGGHALSYFELITAIALVLFRNMQVDVAIMEAGLGGTWDSTSALSTDLLVITPIALDHLGILGNSLNDIAQDKAGAIRSSAPVCSAVQTPEVWSILANGATHHAAPLLCCDKEPIPTSIATGATPMRLQGNFQQDNIRLALLAWRQLHLLGPYRNAGAVSGCAFPSCPCPAGSAAISEASHPDIQSEASQAASPSLNNDSQTVRGLATAWIAGRIQTIPATQLYPPFPCPLGWPPLLLDGAHNAHSMAALGLSIAQQKNAPAAIIFSCLTDKNPAMLVSHLRVLSTGPIFIPPITNNPRAADPAELAKLVGINAVPVVSLHEALTLAAEHMANRLPEAFVEGNTQYPLLVCGSLYLLAEIYALRPDCLE